MSKLRLLLIDEPSAGLSYDLTQNLFEAISEIRNLAITVLLAEQNEQKALEVSSKAMILVQGRKVYDGSPDEISNEEKIAEYFLGTVVA